MAVYLVSYDTHHARNYQSLYDGLAKINAIRLLQSVWMIDVVNDTAHIRDWLRSLLDNDDSIFVLQLNPKHLWAARNLPNGVSDWLKLAI